MISRVLFAIGLLLVVPQTRAAEISCASLIPYEEFERSLYFDAALADGATSKLPVGKWEYGSSALKELFSLQRKSNLICTAVLIKGDIVEGDAKRFFEIIEKQPVDKLYLVSRGGNVAEAIKIGNVVRDRLIQTAAPSVLGASKEEVGRFSFEGDRKFCDGQKCFCASSCFLIWSAGVPRYGAAIGLHRPSIEETAYGLLSAQAAQAKYLEMMNVTRKYMERMEVPKQFIEIAMNTAKDDLYIVGSDRKNIFGIDGYTIFPYPASMKDWLDAKCPMLTNDEMLQTLDPDRRAKAPLEERNRVLDKETSALGCARWVLRAERANIRAKR